MNALDAASDASPELLAKKEEEWSRIQTSAAYKHQKFLADAWCAAFVWPKEPGIPVDAAPTNAVCRQLADLGRKPSTVTVAVTVGLATQYNFFHWHLAFPQVFERGGFDVVLGNPPWERVKLQEQEFFAPRSADISGATNAATRKNLIAKLPASDPQLWRAWCTASREAEGQGHFVRESGRFPLCGQGDVNTYALFAEHNRAVLEPTGRAGFIVPTGIATDNTTKDYFSALVRDGALSTLYDFRNHDGLFYDVGHRRFKFCLLTVLKHPVSTDPARFVFFAESAADLLDEKRQFSLTPDEIRLLNPNTETCPTFRSSRDAEISLRMSHRIPVLVNEADSTSDSWEFRYREVAHMSHQSGIFSSSPSANSEITLLPLFEAKMIHAFNHRWASYREDGELDECGIDHRDPYAEPRPRYWVPVDFVNGRLGSDWRREWRIGWRDICRSTDERTAIFAILPLCAMANTLPLAIIGGEPPWFPVAALNSFAADYATRQRLGGTHLTMSVLRQVPVPPPSVAFAPAAWAAGTASVVDFMATRVLELTYTSHTLRSFALDLGCNGGPFRWDPERRMLLRAELDAAFFLLYGLAREDTDYVLNTFPIVRKNDEKAYGEYRTKRVILERYDAMVDAIRTGVAYTSPLDPPPADPRVAHSSRQGSG